MHKLAKRSRKGERGSVLAMSTISMLALLLATGLAVDVSHFYTVKAEMQNAADAAALAAASQLNSTSGGIKCAITEATKALNKYDFKTSVAVTSADITFATESERNLHDRRRRDRESDEHSLREGRDSWETCRRYFCGAGPWPNAKCSGVGNGRHVDWADDEQVLTRRSRSSNLRRRRSSKARY